MTICTNFIKLMKNKQDKQDKQQKVKQDYEWKKTSSNLEQLFQDLTDEELDLVAGGRKERQRSKRP